MNNKSLKSIVFHIAAKNIDIGDIREFKGKKYKILDLIHFVEDTFVKVIHEDNVVTTWSISNLVFDKLISNA